MSAESDARAAQIARLHEMIAPLERVMLAKMETVIDQALEAAREDEDHLPWSDPNRILGDIRRARAEWQQAEIDRANEMAANYVRLVTSSPILTSETPRRTVK